MTDYTYQETRKQFYNKLENFWADLYGEEYALYDIKYIMTNNEFFVNNFFEYYLTPVRILLEDLLQMLVLSLSSDG